MLPLHEAILEHHHRTEWSVTSSEVKRVLRLDRLQNSRNGNPRYKVTFTDGETAITKSDASCAFTIENSEMRGDVVVTFNRDNEITHLSPAS